MKAKFINIVPKCEHCEGQLAIDELIIDTVNCNYILMASCIVCGEEQIIVLSLEDFIDISRMINGLEDSDENR